VDLGLSRIAAQYFRRNKVQLFSNAFTQFPGIAAILELLLMLVTDPMTMILFVLLVIAAVNDYRIYKIPNWLTMGGALLALSHSVFASSAIHPDFVSSIGGLALGLIVMLPPYALRVMGAGDVKLMAMTGAFLGMYEILPAVIATFVVGGVAAVAFALYRKALRKMFANLKSIVHLTAISAMSGTVPGMQVQGMSSIGRMPYGISICIGTIGYVVARQLGYF
jgi:prepilin peptidase CpaA